MLASPGPARCDGPGTIQRDEFAARDPAAFRVLAVVSHTLGMIASPAADHRNVSTHASRTAAAYVACAWFGPLAPIPSTNPSLPPRAPGTKPLSRYLPMQCGLLRRL